VSPYRLRRYVTATTIDLPPNYATLPLRILYF